MTRIAAAVAAGVTAALFLADLDSTARLAGVVNPALSAQESAVTPGLVRKGKVPVSNDVLKIKLPRATAPAF